MRRVIIAPYLLFINPQNDSRHSLFTVYFLLLLSARGAQVNVTVDDIDPSIVYTPAMSWNSSQVVCSSCDNPSVLVASQQTYHKGIHLMLPDGDDSPTSPAQSTQPSTETSEPPPAPPPPPSAAAPPAPPLNTPTPPPPPPATGAGKPASPTASSAPTGGVTGAEPDDKGGGKNANGGKNGGSTGEKSSGKKPGSRRRGVRLPRLDFDDVGFVDTPVFAQFNFTGELYFFSLWESISHYSRFARHSGIRILYTTAGRGDVPAAAVADEPHLLVRQCSHIILHPPRIVLCL